MAKSKGRYLRGLAKARAARAFTLRELAAAADLNFSTVWRLETLAHGAYPTTTRRLAVALRVDPRVLYGAAPPAASDDR